MAMLVTKLTFASAKKNMRSTKDARYLYFTAHTDFHAFGTLYTGAAVSGIVFTFMEL